MKQIFTSFFSAKMHLLMAMCFLLVTSGAIGQVTATEDFENETAASSFSEGGINFTHTFNFLQNAAPYGYNSSAKFLELANNTVSTNTISATISINNSTNPSVSFKINSFAGYVAAGGSGFPAFNGQVTVSGTPVGSSTPVSATINIASASGSLPSGQTREANGVVNGLNFTGTALAGLYFTSLTFSITDNDKSTVNIGTSYLELDHINFTSLPPSSNQFSITDAFITEGSSGTKPMAFTVSCTSTSAASSVQVQSSNSTATAGSDYVAFPLTTVSFAVGDPTSKTVNVTINGDMTIEPNETFNMTLSNPVGGTLFDGLGVGTILDDDNVTETFEDETGIPSGTISSVTSFSERGFNFVSSGDLFVSRGNNVGAGNCGCTSTALDTRTGNGASSGNIGSFNINSPGTSFDLKSIDVYTSNNDGTSGTTGNVNVTFTGAKADGSGNVSYTATVTPIIGDNYQTVNFTGTPFANVQLLSVSVTLGAGINYVALDNIRYGTVTFSGIQLSINDVSVLEGTGGGTSTATFTVTRSGNSSAFSVNVASSNLSATAGSDYVAYNSTLNFTSGGPLSQTVTVTILRDALIEGNETFNMTLSDATNGVLYQKPVGVGTILDDDKVVETFEDETNGAATFSENSVTFSATGRFKVLYTGGGNSGSGSSKGYLTSSPTNPSPNTGGSQGKIIITSPNKGFKLLQLDGWTANGTIPSFVTGPVTFTGTLYGGGTVTTTKTITPTNNTGTGWQQNITFAGTPFDNAVLTELEFIAGGSVTTVEIDNINYVAVTTLPVIELTDASNVPITNGGAASTTNNTDFGAACTGSSVSKTFTIKNTGAVNLTLSGSPVAVLGGANAAQFSITTQPAATVAANSSTTFTVSYTPTAAGTHNATITLTNNDATNSPYIINIKGTANAAIAIGTQPANVITCAGTTVAFTVAATGSGTLSYQWYKGATALANGATGTGSTISGATTATLTITNPGTADAATNYNVRVSSNTGCTAVTSNNAILTVNALPAISSQPANAVTCAGTAVSFTAAATGSGTLSYQWYKGTTLLSNGPTGTGSTISGVTTVTLTITNPGTADAATNYNVKVSSSTGCTTVTSNNANLTVNTLPAITSQPATTTSTCTGIAVSFTVAASGSGTLSYQWYKGTSLLTNGATGLGSTISGATTTTLTISNPSSADNATNYNVRVSSSTGCAFATSNNAALTVSAPVITTPTVTQPTCSAPTGTIVVNATGGTLEYSINNGTSWQASPTFSSLDAGNYNIKVRLQVNPTCIATYIGNPVTITAVPASPATPTVSVTQPTCSTLKGTITVNTPTGMTYSINGTDYQAGNIFNNLAPGNYSVTAKNGAGCVSASTPVTITAVPASPATPTVSVTQPTCSTLKGTITVSAPTGMTYSINGTDYQAGNIFNNLAPGNYSVTAKNGAGCVSAVTPVIINAVPTDNQPPIIPSNVTVFLNAGGQGSLTSASVAPLITDNCAVNPNSITVSANNFTCANITTSGPHQAYIANTSTGNQPFQGEIGMDFTVNNPNGIQINQLGAFDHQGNGITGTQSGGVRVAIFNQTTQAIVPGLNTIISGSTDPLVANHRMKNIPPVTLMPGNYVIVAKGYNAGELNGNVSFGGGPFAVGDNGSGAITYTNRISWGFDNPATSFDYPPFSTTASTNEYLAGSFNYAIGSAATVNSVTISASDMTGNNTTVNAIVTVVDTFYNMVTRNITVNLDASGHATIQPSDVLVSLKNNCGATITSSTLQVTPSSFDCSNVSGVAAIDRLAYTSNTSTGNQAYLGEIGMDFTVNTAGGIQVNQLGAFDHQANGITGTQSGGVRVAIFNKATQTIVPGLDIVIVGNADGLLSNHRMRNTTPVTLLPGNYVIVAKGYHAAELNGNAGISGGPFANGDNGGGAITYTNRISWGANTSFPSLSYPANSQAGSTNEYHAGTFSYTTTPVPGTKVVLKATDVYGHVDSMTAMVTVENPNNSCSTPVIAGSILPAKPPTALIEVSKLGVYPNPTSGVFNVLLSHFSGDKIDLEITDQNGKLVAIKALTLSSKTPVLTVPFDLGSKASGMYVIRAVSATGVQTAKLLIQR